MGELGDWHVYTNDKRHDPFRILSLQLNPISTCTYGTCPELLHKPCPLGLHGGNASQQALKAEDQINYFGNEGLWPRTMWPVTNAGDRRQTRKVLAFKDF